MDAKLGLTILVHERSSNVALVAYPGNNEFAVLGLKTDVLDLSIFVSKDRCRELSKALLAAADVLESPPSTPIDIPIGQEVKA